MRDNRFKRPPSGGEGGPVETDYNNSRDFDVQKQTQRYLVKALVAVFVFVSFPAAYAYARLQASGGTLFELFIIEMFIIVSVAPITIWYFMGRNATKRNMALQGYQVEWNLDKKRWFGMDTYTLLRADPGRPDGAIIGHNMNPFAVSKRQLKELQQKQRENATCEVCGAKKFNKRAIDRDGGYFVEKRRRLWVLGVPIAERVLEWDFYCSEHEPKTTQYVVGSTWFQI